MTVAERILAKFRDDVDVRTSTRDVPHKRVSNGNVTKFTFDDGSSFDAVDFVPQV